MLDGIKPSFLIWTENTSAVLGEAEQPEKKLIKMGEANLRILLAEVSVVN